MLADDSVRKTFQPYARSLPVRSLLVGFAVSAFALLKSLPHHCVGGASVTVTLPPLVWTHLKDLRTPADHLNAAFVQLGTRGLLSVLALKRPTNTERLLAL